MSLPLRYKNEKHDISPYMREVQELRDLTVYENTGITITRRLRERYKSYKISQFTRNAQESRYLAVYERGTRVTRSHSLREHRKHDISSYTREIQELRDLTFYENTGNTISRHLRVRYKSYEISQFTRTQEIRYLAVCERSKRDSRSRPLTRCLQGIRQIERGGRNSGLSKRYMPREKQNNVRITCTITEPTRPTCYALCNC